MLEALGGLECERAVLEAEAKRPCGAASGCRPARAPGRGRWELAADDLHETAALADAWRVFEVRYRSWRAGGRGRDTKGEAAVDIHLRVAPPTYLVCGGRTTSVNNARELIKHWHPPANASGAGHAAARKRGGGLRCTDIDSSGCVDASASILLSHER